MSNTTETSREMEANIDPNIKALWALIMGYFAGRPALCVCCDTLSQQEDEKREEILKIFRNMGFEETIDCATRDYFAWLNGLRRAGQWYGWPHQTLQLNEELLLKRILRDAPKVLEANHRRVNPSGR